MEGSLKVRFGEIIGCGSQPLFIVFSAWVILAGCTPKASLPYEVFIQSSVTGQEESNKSNAYNDYISAAQEFEKNLGPHVALMSKSSFSPTEQDWIEQAATEPLKQVKAGLQRSCQIPYCPSGSAQALEGRAAWRLLSKVLIWRIQRACDAQAYEGAIETSVLASKFGFDLAAGLPDDASLGLITVDEARQAIAGGLNEMSAAQLDMLAKSMKTIFLNRPSMGPCYDNVEKDSLLQVQELQDYYRSEDYAGLNQKLGSVAKEIVPVLKELHRQSDARRVAFFEGFAQQAKDEAAQTKQKSLLPVAERVQVPAPSPTTERPWKKVARRMIGIGEPLLRMSDATQARTELLILEAQILRARKVDGKTPPDLSKFSVKVSTDPYSGQPFIYRTDGSDYKLYSVGEDLIDNDGETDETYTTPDLKLERKSH